MSKFKQFTVVMLTYAAGIWFFWGTPVAWLFAGGCLLSCPLYFLPVSRRKVASINNEVQRDVRADEPEEKPSLGAWP